MWPHGRADLSVVLKDSVRASSVMPSSGPASVLGSVCAPSFSRQSYSKPGPSPRSRSLAWQRLAGAPASPVGLGHASVGTQRRVSSDCAAYVAMRVSVREARKHHSRRLCSEPFLEVTS